MFCRLSRLRPTKDVLPEEVAEAKQRPKLNLPSVGSRTRLPNRKLRSEFVGIVEQLESARAMLDVVDDKEKFTELQDRYLDLLVRRHREAKGEIPRDASRPIDIEDVDFRGKVADRSAEDGAISTESDEESAIVREGKQILFDSLGVNGISGFFNHETVTFEDAVDVGIEVKDAAVYSGEAAIRLARAIDRGLGKFPSSSLAALNDRGGMTIKLRHEPDAAERREIAEQQLHHAEYLLEELLGKLRGQPNSPLDGIINDRPRQNLTLQEQSELRETLLSCQQIVDPDRWEHNFKINRQYQLYAERIQDQDFERLGYTVAQGRDTVNERALLEKLQVQHEPRLDRTWLNSDSLLGFLKVRALVDCLKVQSKAEGLVKTLTSGVALAETESERNSVLTEVKTELNELHLDLTTTLTTSIFEGCVFGHDYAPRLDTRQQVRAFHLISELERRQHPESVASQLIAQTASRIPKFIEHSIGSSWKPKNREALSAHWTEEGLYDSPASTMSDQELYQEWQSVVDADPALEQEAGALYEAIRNSVQAYQPLFQSVHNASQDLEASLSIDLEGAVRAESNGIEVQYDYSEDFEMLVEPLRRLAVDATQVLNQDLGTRNDEVEGVLAEFQAKNQNSRAQSVLAAEFVRRVTHTFLSPEE